MVRHIIFDLDGVLIDTAPLHYKALNRALHHFGYEIPWDEHQKEYDGLPTQKKLDRLSGRRSFPTTLHSLASALKQKFTLEALNEITPDPTVRAMILSLKEKGFSIALGSNCIRKTIDITLKNIGVLDLFDFTVSAEDVSKPKPAPDIYLECLRRWGISKDEVVIIEDSLPGITAARATTPNVMTVTQPEEVTADSILKFVKSVSTIQDTKPLSQVAPLPLQILIPMAGKGQRFSDAGYVKPKPFIDVIHQPMIQWVIENVRPKNRAHNFVFLVNSEHAKTYQVEASLTRICPGSKILLVPGVTEGAACTALLASDAIDPEAPLLIANSDQWVNASVQQFIDTAITKNIDGFIMTFPAKEKKWSFAKTNSLGRVTEVAEKNPISEHATVGIYYFKRAADFFKASEEMILKDLRVNGEFYVCPVYNELIAQGKVVEIFEIPKDAMHGLGTPEDLERFLIAQPDPAQNPLQKCA